MTYPNIQEIDAAMHRLVECGEIAGVVSLVARPDQIIHLGAVGYSDIEGQIPMQPDTVFRIASMSKPVCSAAFFVLEQEGLVKMSDPVAEYIPDFKQLLTPSGKPANLTIEHVLTHTSGLSDLPFYPRKFLPRNLAEEINIHLAGPMIFEPGSQWAYSQSGINTVARIIEIISGQPYPVYLERRIFRPLGIEDMMHHPDAGMVSRLAVVYNIDPEKGGLVPKADLDAPPGADVIARGNSGIYATAPAYARFCQMLLNNGTLDGCRILTPESVNKMATPLTGHLESGFVPGTPSGPSTLVVEKPQGITAMLSAGSFGHGGMFGTQAWIDRKRELAYILMIQRGDIGNGDASIIRQRFQETAANAVFGWTGQD